MDKILNQGVEKISLVNLQNYPSIITISSLIRTFSKSIIAKILLRESKEDNFLERESEKRQMK